jgi:nucleoside-diphosphate-sugar epimerase
MSTGNPRSPTASLTVAVTGPTGEIGLPFIGRLEQVPEVGRIVAMARRPFDPAEHGWRKTTYQQGDICDRSSVDALVAGADVVVHLAFIVVKATPGSHDINVEGSRNVFEATAAAGAKRLVYTSSVAAYGYGCGDDTRLTEEMPAAGTTAHAYSQQKAEVESVLADALAGAETEAYVFRPCIVAGPQSQALLNALPYIQVEERIPATLTDALGRLPWVAPLLPDHGILIQLVHHDDVADALIAAVIGKGPPGIYNLAGDGELTIADIADELGWHAIKIPRQAVDLTAGIISRIPPLEVPAGWLEMMRASILMDTSLAKSELGWQPAHDAAATLREMVSARP